LNRDDVGLEAVLAEQSRARRSGERATYLSLDELRDDYGAPVAETDAVEAYFSGLGLSPETEPVRSFAWVELTHEQVEEIFQTELGRYRVRGEGADGEFLALDTAPTLPEELVGLVAAVEGLSTRGARESLRRKSSPTPIPVGDSSSESATALWSCDSGSTTKAPTTPMFSPMQANKAYGIDVLQAGVSILEPGKTSPTVVKLLGDNTRAALISTAPNEADLAAFLECFKDYYDQPISIDYHGSAQTGSFEGVMDLQALIYAAPHVEHIDFYPDDNQVQSLTAIMNADPAPDVLTLSVNDLVVSQAVSDKLFQTGAVRGVASFSASGDSGPGYCSDGPFFSPFLTLVGGTTVTLSSDGTIADQVPMDVILVGSRSEFTGSCQKTGYPSPAYQNGVPGMVSPHPERSSPDIANLSDGAAIYQEISGEQTWVISTGTSFASPYTASGALLLAQASKLAGNGPLGSLNDLAYSAAQLKTSAGASEWDTYFYDITHGGNCSWIPNPTYIKAHEIACTSGITAPPPECFMPDPNCKTVAHQYFDIPSGLGTIKFDALVDRVIAKPAD
jgi:subtilase family serine protease